MKKSENMTLFVDSPRGLLSAIVMTQNSMVPTSMVNCESTAKMFKSSPMSEMQMATDYINSIDGSFAKSQLRATAYEYAQHPFMNKASLKITRTYMCTPKELNDVRCVTAEIGGILKTSLGTQYTFEQAMRKYQKWINKYFDYKNTGNLSDHTAIGLLTNRTGVCQAIAAVTMLVFPYLGFPVVYVPGEAKGNGEWGPHAWNAIKTRNGWIHVDFTFGMSNFYTPNTNNGMLSKLFKLDHKWDEKKLAQEKMSEYMKLHDDVRESKITLQENKLTAVIGDVTVRFSEPVIVGNRSSGHWINLFNLLPLVGGACELLPNRNQLRICLYNKDFLINNANSLINKQTGYVRVSALSEFVTILDGNNSSIQFKLGLKHE